MRRLRAGGGGGAGGAASGRPRAPRTTAPAGPHSHRHPRWCWGGPQGVRGATYGAVGRRRPPPPSHRGLPLRPAAPGGRGRWGSASWVGCSGREGTTQSGKRKRRELTGRARRAHAKPVAPPPCLPRFPLPPPPHPRLPRTASAPAAPAPRTHPRLWDCDCSRAPPRTPSPFGRGPPSTPPKPAPTPGMAHAAKRDGRGGWLRSPSTRALWSFRLSIALLLVGWIIALGGLSAIQEFCFANDGIVSERGGGRAGGREGRHARRLPTPPSPTPPPAAGLKQTYVTGFKLQAGLSGFHCSRAWWVAAAVCVCGGGGGGEWPARPGPSSRTTTPPLLRAGASSGLGWLSSSPFCARWPPAPG